jgi:hypothetical protein
MEQKGIFADDACDWKSSGNLKGLPVEYWQEAIADG